METTDVAHLRQQSCSRRHRPRRRCVTTLSFWCAVIELTLAALVVGCGRVSDPTNTDGTSQAIARDRDALEHDRGATIDGRVVDELGRPVIGATVTAQGPALLREATTGSTGEFDFDHLPVERVSLSAKKAGLLPTVFGQRGPLRPSRQIDLWEDSSWDNIELVLHSGGRIVGRVLDTDGRPIVGAVVSVSRVNSSTASRPGSRLATQPIEVLAASIATGGRPVATNSDGRFMLAPLPSGSYYVSTIVHSSTPPKDQSEGYGRSYYPSTNSISEAIPVIVEEHKDSEVVVVAKRTKLSSVSGIVVDSIGKRIEGATIRVEHDRASGPVEFLEAAAMARSRGDGTFVAGGLPPGNYILVASKTMDGLPPNRKNTIMMGTKSISLSPGAHVNDISLTMYFGAVIRGILATSPSRHGHEIKPGDVRLFSVPLYRPETFLPVSVDVGSSGDFEIQNVFGPAILSSGLERFGMELKQYQGERDVSSAGLRADSGALISQVRLVLSERKSISGLVRRAGGGVAAADVIAISANPKLWTDPIGRYVSMVATDDSGRFSIYSLPVGDYLVIARDQLSIDVKNDEVELSRLASEGLTVTVRDAAVTEVAVMCGACRAPVWATK